MIHTMTLALFGLIDWSNDGSMLLIYSADRDAKVIVYRDEKCDLSVHVSDGDLAKYATQTTVRWQRDNDRVRILSAVTRSYEEFAAVRGSTKELIHDLANGRRLTFRIAPRTRMSRLSLRGTKAALKKLTRRCH